MRASLSAAEAAISARREGEYGRWRDWYRGDWFVGFPVTRDILRANVALMSGEAPAPGRGVVGSSEVYRYQERFSENFPFLYRESSPGR
ncbi:hypothetical protein HS125_08175 [bacterium]|nr:hypothetical protein [bacterium]